MQLFVRDPQTGQQLRVRNVGTPALLEVLVRDIHAVIEQRTRLNIFPCLQTGRSNTEALFAVSSLEELSAFSSAWQTAFPEARKLLVEYTRLLGDVQVIITELAARQYESELVCVCAGIAFGYIRDDVWEDA